MNKLIKYKEMSKEQFLGNPTIIPDLKTVSIVTLPALLDEQREPFLDGKYKVVFKKFAALVFDGDKVIATRIMTGNGDVVNIAVDPAYRKQGIASELVYQYVVRYLPDRMNSTQRTVTTQKICEAVWNRIQKEIA